MEHPLARSLVVSDLHLTSNARDEYRWGLFPWIRSLEGIERLWILGDLTDAKDYHPAHLVNRLVDEIETLAQSMEVYILRGNHDGIDPEWPYFRFLNAIPNVVFLSEPAVIDKEILALPHTRDWQTDWSGLDLDYKVILLHATMMGAEAEAGGSLSGIPTSFFSTTKAQILAGDVHVPQLVGPVEYVGAPYPIRFGDHFTPRALYFDEKGKPMDLHYETLRRVSIVLVGEKNGDLETWTETRRGDQVKVRVRLSRAGAMDWHKIKSQIQNLCKEMGVTLVSLELERLPDNQAVVLKAKGQTFEPEATLDKYCKQKRIGQALRSIGEALLKTTRANALKTP